MNLTRIGILSNLVSNDLKRKPIIIVPANNEGVIRVTGSTEDLSMTVDTDEWSISEEQKKFVQEVAKLDISIEEKILKIYEELCNHYTYDDNVLSYIRKNDDDTFFLPDEYGRDTDSEWKEKRKQHNRRNCFEISRILAQSLKELMMHTGCAKSHDICIIWDEAVTHYLVGLISRDYCISLDLDDFTQIKDITRVKTGLTIEGIKVLYDPNEMFKNVLDEYNQGREKIAKKSIERHQTETIQSTEVDKENDCDDVEFLRLAVQILKEEYNLDSAGIYEYMKEIVDTKLGARCRKKVWKDVEDNSENVKRYTRCLIVTIDEKSYVIDVTKEKAEDMFRILSPEELDNEHTEFIPFKSMSRNWSEEPYDGR